MAAPVASNVVITGTLKLGSTLTGTYTYTCADAEGTSTFRWLRDGVAISAATAITHVIVAADVETLITFEVTPISNVPTSGTAVASAGVVPLQLWAITTLSKIKDDLHLDTTITTDDVALGRWIDEESLEMENYIERKIVVQTITDEYHDGDGTDLLYTKYAPVYALGAVGANDAAKLAALQHRLDIDEAWEDVEDDLDHIILDPEKEYIQLFEESFYDGLQTVKITYQAGYSTIPSELERQCRERVRLRYLESLKPGADGRFGIQSKSKAEGGGSVNINFKDMRTEWERQLDPYVKSSSIDYLDMMR